MADGREIKNRITWRQGFPDAFIPTGGMYLFKTENLMQGNLYGNTPSIIETEPTINLNSIEDWNLAVDFLERENA